MAYQSRIYSTTFKYDPYDNTADDFNTRLGRVLNEGAYSVMMKLLPAADVPAAADLLSTCRESCMPANGTGAA